jgi:chromosome partitioning protein
VLLVERAPRDGMRSGLESLQSHYNDIFIDTEGCDTLDSRSALIAARLAVVPIHVDEVDLVRQYKLIDRLNSARMFNPGLRVVFVIVGGAADPSREELAAVRAYVAQVMSATLAGTVIHAPGAMAADMGVLYREVFAR